MRMCLFLILMLFSSFSFASINCNQVSIPSLVKTFDIDSETLKHIIQLYNFTNSSSQTTICTDLVTSEIFYSPSQLSVLVQQVNRYIQYAPQYTMSAIDQEMQELRSLTFEDWSVISLSLVGVFVVAFLIVQIRHLINKM